MLHFTSEEVIVGNWAQILGSSQALSTGYRECLKIEVV